MSYVSPALQSRFESLSIDHVGASFISLAPTFFKSQSAFMSLFHLFRKRSRSARLLGPKRPHDGSLSLPTFCGMRLRRMASFLFPVDRKTRSCPAM